MHELRNSILELYCIVLYKNVKNMNKIEKNKMHNTRHIFEYVVHCCMKCPQILREKTSSEKYTEISL